MRILFDNGVPDQLLRFLEGHSVELARRRGWAEISNGDLLRMAIEGGFEVLLTNDRGFRFQQNPTGRSIDVILLRNFGWPISDASIDAIRAAIERIDPGELIELRL